MAALFAAINPAVSHGETLAQQIDRVLDDVAKLSTPTTTVCRSIYASMTDLCERLDLHKRELSLAAPAEERLEALLFGPDLPTEALRLVRAQAVVSVSKRSISMAQRLRPEILALLAAEKSKAVLECIKNAPHVKEG